MTRRLTGIASDGVWVETERSAPEGIGAQLVPAWMFNVAWSELRDHGEITNDKMLDVFQARRSSAVLAILALIPGVSVASTRSPVCLVREK